MLPEKEKASPSHSGVPQECVRAAPGTPPVSGGMLAPGFLSLVRQFDDSGRKNVASSHADVVRDEILRRCQLTDSPDDSLRWRQSVEGTEWRRQIAGRLAATMIVSGRSNLALDATTGAAEAGVLSPSDLGCTDEIWEHQRVAPKLADFDSLVHRASLLRRIGTKGRWIFESQVHQEWLAADWLAARELGISRLKQIFGVETEVAWTVAPPLRSTAAWLARFDGDFRELVLRHDPLTLLRMDGACLPDSERGEIVEALLNATDTIRVLDPAIRHSHLPSLKHSGLVNQLERWLTRSDATDAAKRLAIELAEKTNLVKISEVLWRVYPTSGKTLRPELAGALLRLAKEGHDDKWRAVLNGGIPIDAHGNLLGAALTIMVIDSRKIPVREILQHVLPERRFEVFGLYESSALHLHEHLTVDDLPAVFDCLAENIDALWDSHARAREFNDAAVRLAINEIHRPEIQLSLVEYWYACLRRHFTPTTDSSEFWKGKETERLDFVRALVHHPEFKRNHQQGWVDSNRYLVEHVDFEWCLNEMEADAPGESWRFAMLASAMIWQLDLTGKLGQILDASWEQCEPLRGMLPSPQNNESVSQTIIRVAAEKRAGREAQKRSSDQLLDQRRKDHQDRLAGDTERCREGPRAW